MFNLYRFIFIDILKNKILIIYFVLLSLLSWSVFSLEENSNKGILTLLNLVLLIIPIVSLIFTNIYIYNSTEFINLLLSQPIKRKQIWLSLFFGLTSILILVFILAVCVPIIIYCKYSISIILILTGILINIIFVSLAFLSAVIFIDKAKGLGFSILIWMYFALIFDGLVLYLLFQFSQYPIEKLIVFITSTNPIDLTRILNILQLDTNVMMGYTGAIFNKYFGKGISIFYSFIILILWAILPYYISFRIFKNKNL